MVIVVTIVARMLHLVTDLISGLPITDLPVVVTHHNHQSSWYLVPGTVSRCQDAGGGDDGSSTERSSALLLGDSNLPWILVLEGLLASNYFGHPEIQDSTKLIIQSLSIKPVRLTT